MEKTTSPAKPNDDEFNKYIVKSFLELSGIDGLSKDLSPAEKMLNRVSHTYNKNKDLFEIVNNMQSSQVPDKVSFIDEVQHNTTMAIVETYATYMFVKDKFEEIISDANKYAEIKPTPEQQRVQDKFLQVYSLYVGMSVGLKRLQNIDELKTTLKVNTATYKKIPLYFDKIGEEMNEQIKELFITPLQAFNDNGNIKTSEDYAMLMRGVLEGFKEFINFERKDGAYKDLQDLVSKESFNIKGVTFRGFDKAEKKGYDVGSWPTLDMVIGMEDVIKKGTRIINKMMTYDPETKENSIHPGEQIINIVGDSGCGKGFVISALSRYAVDLAEKLGKPINIIMMSPDKFRTSYMNDSANKLTALFEDLYEPNSINLGIMEEIDTAVEARESAQKEGRGDSAMVTGAFLRMTSTTRKSPLGNWLLMVDTNTQIKDPAMKTRLGEPIIGHGAESSEQFIKMLSEVHLKDGVKKKYLTVKKSEWKEIGDLCENYFKTQKLSGRDIENISGSLKAYANDFEIKPEFLKMNIEEQKDYVSKNLVYKPVDKKMIMDRITVYMTSLKEANDREVKERRQQKIQEWKEMDEAQEMYEPLAKEQFRRLAAKYLPENVYTPLMKYLPSAAFDKAKEEAEKEVKS